MTNLPEQPAISIPKKVFCNRALNLKNIKAIGFDMDYTLGLYYPETFEVLAYSETLKKLVKNGYPEVILQWQFDWKYMLRGLVIDKARGNVIKLDRHHYVKVAMHGFKEITREERRNLYDASKVQMYEEPNFALIDTLFSLAEAYLFCQLVELKDAQPNLISKTYQEIYKDIRKTIDMAHRDGSIKDAVAKDPQKYISRDPLLVKTIQNLKNSGRKLFIVTNSLWEYTNVVMSYLFEETTESFNWLSYFDLVIVGASKPGFFMYKNQIYEVSPTTGWLKNTAATLGENKVFQGGNFQHLHDFLKIKIGSEILYVGDHIYGDILRSKKELGWRTMLIIEELEHEINIRMKNEMLKKNIEKLMKVKDTLENRLQFLLWNLECFIRNKDVASDAETQADDECMRQEIRSLAEERNTVREDIREHMREYHERFHPIWGELLKTGHQNSRFAQQVEVYACLYTSRVSNFLKYPPFKTFQSTPDYMPHERIIEEQ